jgi:hypothetical protein
MSQWTRDGIKGFPRNIAIGAHLRVMLSGGVLAVAGVNDVEVGTTDSAYFWPPLFGASNVPHPTSVLLRSAQGTCKMVANGAINQGANVYAAANGLVSATGTLLIGVALESVLNSGDTVEVLRGNPSNGSVQGLLAGVLASGLKVTSGQWTTATAADTVPTGLTTVVGVIASLESDPADVLELVTAQIGNQSGAPVAGSVIIKTWHATSTSVTTPVAAATFGKKVNWIAFGQ